ncbi:MAG: hypothetical protein KGL53_07565 [Elusimicrobia bacterium]|nr:hypothetical protein [Elusimicrobiota bacterium]
MPEEPEEPAVEPEIVEPGPREPAPRRSFFHPLSGAAILGIDWLAFGADAATGMAAMALVCLAAFAGTYYAVYAVQRGLRGDTPEQARMKALIGGVAAGVPFPITGTVVGGLILMLSGLPSSARPGRGL